MDKFESALITSLLTPLGNPNNKLCKWGIVANFIGGSGVGKSARITEISNALGMPCFTIFSATKTPEHIGGFPANTEQGFMLRCALPQVLYAIDAQRAVIFLDEISTAPPAVQAALLSFVNERTVGEYSLPVQTRIVMAMNPAEVAANGHDLEIPMANRIAHFKYTPPTIQQWADYLIGNSTLNLPSIKNGEDLVKSRWLDQFPQVAGLARTFMESNSGQYAVKVSDEEGKDSTEQHNKLYDQPDPSDPRAAGPWPSHRTWYWAMHGVVAARCLDMPPTVETDIVEALVGDGLAIEWATFVKKMDIPRPEDVLTKGWDIPKRMDLVQVVLNACSTYVVNIPDKTAQVGYAVACWELLGGAIKSKGYADISVEPVQRLIHAGLDTTCPHKPLQDASEQVCTYLYDSGYMKYLP